MLLGRLWRRVGHDARPLLVCTRLALETLVVLLHKARANTTPPHILKQELVAQAGTQVLRTAVQALMAKAARKAQERPKPEPAASPNEEALKALADSTSSAGLAGPANFVSAMIKDEFRVQLVHAFHCRTASCPV